MQPRTRAQVEVELAAALVPNTKEAHLLASELDRMGPKPPPTRYDAARWYAAQGWPIFPLRPGSKRPHRGTSWAQLVADGGVDPTWWANHPQDNLALATGHHYDVIDFDGITGHTSWGHHMPPTYPEAGLTVCGTVSTPRPGGLHVYVHTTGRPNGAALLPGVDYRGAGGYVVLPPSTLDAVDGQHPGTYQWLRQPHQPGEVPA